MNVYMILLVIVCLLIIGTFLEDIFNFKENKKYSPPGTILSQDKGNTFVYSKGTGNATVVFLPGITITSAYCEFYNLQNEIAKIAKTAIYESYGYGFSDDSSKYTSLNEYVDDLRYFLKRCGHTPPYIFICHSTSSLQTLYYSKLYPKEVAGIIFENAINPKYINYLKIPPKLFLRTLTFLKFTGVLRVSMLIPTIKKKLLTPFDNKTLNNLNKSLFLKNFLNENILQEIYNLKRNCFILTEKEINLEKTPIRIIHSSNKNFSSNEAWIKSQEDMLTWSDNSAEIIVKNNHNSIHSYDTKIFVSIIKELINNDVFDNYI